MQAKRGDTVHVHYRGTLDDGTEFDSTSGGEPISFTIGSGQLIDGFEKAIEGMEPGDRKTERFEPADAYGDRHEELQFDVDRDELPEDEEVEVGDILQVGFPDGGESVVTVTAVGKTSVTLDSNHPMAGKALTFELELVKIE